MSSRPGAPRRRRPSAAAALAASQLLPREDKLKTELCHNYSLLGACKWGDNCCFAHGAQELRAEAPHGPNFKLKPCDKFNHRAFCAYGSRCQYVHCFTYAESLRAFVERACATLKETPDTRLSLLLARAKGAPRQLSIFSRLKRLF